MGSYALGEYAASRIGSVKKVYKNCDTEIEAVIKGLEPEVSYTLARMERRGIRVDKEELASFKVELQEQGRSAAENCI
ncbi:MAG: hypothetical protein QY318_01705 [Candidatus Dojkabacteria bacterium]|nr:MAG: hypothetical protein QY318_01705 [Candidatus Dojkabacteria bacterium]